MSNHAYFFNSIEGDRKYDADSMTDWLKPFFKTGVFNGGCQVVSNNNMTVNVKVGYVNIDGKVKHFDEEETLVISAAHSTLNRIDNICIRRNDTDRDITLYIQEGTQSAVPVAPTPVRDSGIYDLVIAQIYVNAAAVSITQSSITDTRMDPDLCGWVVSNVEEVDFEQIVQSWETFIAEFKERNQDEFDAWFEEMKDQLSEDAAGHLQLEIDDINNRVDDIVEELNPSIALTLVASDGASCEGLNVKVTDTDSGNILYDFEYEQPVNLPMAMLTNYIIEVESKQHYVTPSPRTGQVKYATPITATFTYTLGKRYGFRRTKADSSCSNRISYLYDAVGMTPAKYNFSLDKFEAGSWGDFIEEIARPVMLKRNGVVDYELDHNNQKKKLDGTTSDILSDAYDGNAMVEFRKYKYVNRYQDETYEYVILSDVKWDEDYLCDAFINDAGEEKDTCYYSMFLGRTVNSIMRSNGVTSNPTANTTAATEMTTAKANGNGWNMLYWSLWNYVADILTLISKTDDSQGAFGKGRGGQSSILANGQLTEYGAFKGYNNDTSAVKVLWIENFWGNLWTRTNGCILNGTIRVKMHGPYPTPTDSAATYSNYVDTGAAPSGTSGNGTKTNKENEYGYLPQNAGGSYSTYVPDSYYFNTSQIDFAFVGAGSYTAVGRAGSRCLNLYSVSSSTSADYGSRLSYIPD